MLSVLIQALTPLVFGLAADAFAPSQKNLSWLLGPPGSTPQIGPERGAPVQDGIATYRSPFGSSRFVLYIAGRPVSALQVMTMPDGRNVIANVYTVPELRKQGAANALLQTARAQLGGVQHSENLSPAGRAWMQRVETPGYSHAPALSATTGPSELLGYKVVGQSADARLFSLYDGSTINAEPGTIESRRGGLYLGTSEEFVTDYYTGMTDEREALLTYRYSSADLISGDPDSEGEVKVAKAELVSVQEIEED